MTKKRFYKVLTDCVVQDTLNNELIRGSRIADVMNELHEENQRLKVHLLKYTDCDYEDIQEICKDENLSEWWNDMND